MTEAALHLPPPQPCFTRRRVLAGAMALVVVLAGAGFQERGLAVDRGEEMNGTR